MLSSRCRRKLSQQTSYGPSFAQVWRQRARLTIKILRGDNPAMASAAARLLRAYAAQVEPLRRLRNGGSQIVRRTCKTAVRTETLEVHGPLELLEAFRRVVVSRTRHCRLSALPWTQ